MSLQLIFGPMFSGKTSELIRRINRYKIANKNVVAIKYSKDTRYSKNEISTHDNKNLEALSCLKLNNDYDNYDVIAIDEGQFFDNILDFTIDYMNKNKIIIIAALDGTFQQKPFNNILDLVPYATKLTKLSAICMICKNEAHYSHRITKETELEVIGGMDKYIACCYKCLKNKN